MTEKTELRFYAKIDYIDGCWVWLGKVAGRSRVPVFWYENRSHSARRVAWLLDDARPPLSEDDFLSLTCKTRNCVNPEHMEVMRRGCKKPQETCRRGHKLTDDNIYITTQEKRACRKCIAITLEKRKARYLREGRGWGNTYKRKESDGKAQGKGAESPGRPIPADKAQAS